MKRHAELLQQLIRIPSVNPMGRDVEGPPYFETALSNFLERWLLDLGLPVRRQNVLPGRDNILASYVSPSPQRSVLLEVHQDTVPPDGMVIEPFGGAIEGNRIYGRGACDNKGPMTAMLLAMERLVRERPTGAPSVTLALTVDEEYTFHGASALAAQGLDFDAAIVAEPTELDLIVAHKGIVRWEIHTDGRACHSSTPEQGVNAIYRMARVLSAIEDYARELSARPAHRLLGRPTVAVGEISGGTAPNIVPDACRINVDRRLIPGEAPSAARAELMEYLRLRPGIDFSPHASEPWSELAAMGGPACEDLGARLLPVVAAAKPDCRIGGVAYGTDAGVYVHAGLPCVVFGPGNIQQAHTKDEWCPLDEVETAADLYYRMCLELGRDG